jgi:pimeloyl-ACP methyl ester carboxylesterase
VNSLALLALTLAVPVALVAVSHLVERLRQAPPAPDRLAWAPEIPILYTSLDGCRIRYIRAGTGPTLVLLHTLRTQLDLFEKVVRDLAKTFTVFALDYPGHGYSDIPDGNYDAEFFTRYVGGFLCSLDLRDATLCGVSIGGAIALILAGRGDPRVTRVVAVNPYDYARGRGMARSSLLGRMITVTSERPLIAGTVMRLRNFLIMNAVFRGGVADPESIPPRLLREMYLVGNRPGHYQAFVSLLRHASSWEAATAAYEGISVPVCLIWGDRDWSRPAERERDRRLIPRARMLVVEGGGHFLPLDRPDTLTELIRRFVRENPA